MDEGFGLSSWRASRRVLWTPVRLILSHMVQYVAFLLGRQISGHPGRSQRSAGRPPVRVACPSRDSETSSIRRRKGWSKLEASDPDVADRAARCPRGETQGQARFHFQRIEILRSVMVASTLLVVDPCLDFGRRHPQPNSVPAFVLEIHELRVSLLAHLRHPGGQPTRPPPAHDQAAGVGATGRSGCRRNRSRRSAWLRNSPRSSSGNVAVQAIPVITPIP